MKFLQQGVAFGLVMLSLAGLGLAQSDCAASPHGRDSVAGVPWNSPGGGLFCDTKWREGKVITAVEVWGIKHHLKGIRVTFSDGHIAPTRGRQEGDYQKIEWKEDQRIDEVWYYMNKDEDAVGRLYIKVAGKELDIGRGKWGERVDVHSGYLIGSHGRNGHWLDTLSFKFLRSPVKSAEIIDIKFKNDLKEWNKKHEGIEQVSLSSVCYENTETGQEHTFEFEGTHRVMTSKTMEQSTSNTFGVSVGVTVGASVGVPLIASAYVEATTEVSYETTSMESRSQTTEREDTLSWNRAGKILEGEVARCDAYVFSGTYRSEYESTVQVELADGTKYKINRPGYFESTGYTDVVNKCVNRPEKEAKGLCQSVERKQTKRALRGVHFRV